MLMAYVLFGYLRWRRGATQAQALELAEALSLYPDPPWGGSKK